MIDAFPATLSILQAAGVDLQRVRKEVVIVCASAAGPGLTHHGLLHSATADLARTLAPLVAGRLARGEPVLAVLPTTTAAALRLAWPGCTSPTRASSTTIQVMC